MVLIFMVIIHNVVRKRKKTPQRGALEALGQMFIPTNAWDWQGAGKQYLLVDFSNQRSWHN